MTELEKAIAASVDEPHPIMNLGRALTSERIPRGFTSPEEEQAFNAYKQAANELASATSIMKARQLQFSAALQKLTAIVAPIEETK